MPRPEQIRHTFFDTCHYTSEEGTLDSKLEKPKHPSSEFIWGTPFENLGHSMVWGIEI